MGFLTHSFLYLSESSSWIKTFLWLEERKKEKLAPTPTHPPRQCNPHTESGKGQHVMNIININSFRSACIWWKMFHSFRCDIPQSRSAMQLNRYCDSTETTSKCTSQLLKRGASMMCSSYCRNPALLFSGKRTPIRKYISRTLSLRDWDLTTCCRPWDEVLGLTRSRFSASEEGQRTTLRCSTFVKILSQNQLMSWKMGTILPSVRQIRLDRLGRGFAGRWEAATTED